MKTSTFSVINFGCRTTQSDGAAIEEALLNKNLRKEEIEGKSDLVIINTCTVTKTADAEARKTIRRIHRRNPDTKIVVTGCYAQRAPEEIIQIRGVTSVIGNSHKDQLASLIVNNHLSVKDSLVNKENSSILPGGPSVYCSSIFESTELRSIADMSGGGRTRAFLKVQDGCSYRCSYCVIPFVRGHSRSLPLEEVLYQVRNLLRQGYREIVLTGIHLGGYGRELKNKTDLAGLIRRLLKEKSLIRLRLSSIEPLEMTDEIIELVATSPKMAKHFHVPLQSGSGRVLRLMRRPYQPDEYFRLVERIRKNVPNAAIGADLMVGFPTETTKDHALTRDLILNSPLTYLHVFPFSSRPGTQAAHIQDTIPKTISDQRSLDLRKIGEQKNRSFRKSQIGRSISVITLETKKSEGTTKALSSNFLRVNLPDLSVQPNQFLNVQVTSINKTGVRAIPVNASFG